MNCKPPGKNPSEAWRHKYGQYFKPNGNQEIIRKDGKVAPLSEYSILGCARAYRQRLYDC